MIAFKNIKNNQVISFGNPSDTPRLYAETIALTSANKELKPEEIEWELIENYEPPKEPKNESNPKLERYNELVNKLNSTDYMALKVADGDMTEQEYAPIKLQRHEWRAEAERLGNELRAEGVIK